MGTFILDDCDRVLYLACGSKCQPAVIEQLLQKGADPNAKGKNFAFFLCFRPRLNFVQASMAGALFTKRVGMAKRTLFCCCWLTVRIQISKASRVPMLHELRD